MFFNKALAFLAFLPFVLSSFVSYEDLGIVQVHAINMGVQGLGRFAQTFRESNPLFDKFFEAVGDDNKAGLNFIKKYKGKTIINYI